MGHPDTTYVDENIFPGYYIYYVTAVYDLTPYGYPGDTAESVEEGPAIISGVPLFDLEFFEDWESGTFNHNLWIPGASNWSVNGEIGNPAPSAEFSGDPVLSNYDVSLESSFTYCSGDDRGHYLAGFRSEA